MNIKESKRIPLTQGQVAIVDADDYDFLMQWKWFADWKPSTQSFYAARKSRVGERPHETTIMMHRIIANAPNGSDCDHHNTDTLDNRKQNIRVCSRSQNNANRKKAKNNTSGYKGVSHRHNTTNKVWEARIKRNGKLEHLGVFESPEEAHAAYCNAALAYFGEFART